MSTPPSTNRNVPPSTHRPGSLHRRSLFNLMEINAASSPLQGDQANNDEQERQRKRDSVRRTLTDQSMTDNSPQKDFSESFLLNEFSTCAKLFTENKITSKNVWDLRIIDILQPLCKRKNTDLQVAGTSLEISTKVFAIRVDDLHSRGMKLANDMARVAANHELDNAEDQGSDAEDGNDDGERAPRQKRPKKRRAVNPNGPKRTVAREADKYVGPLPKLDPVDISNRVKADFGNIENLCTSTLRMNSKGCTFVVLDENERFNTAVDIDLSDGDDRMIELAHLPLVPVGTSKIMSIQDFKFNKENVDNQRKVTTRREDGSVPSIELDGSIVDPFQNNDNEGDLSNDAASIHEERVNAAEGSVARGHLVDASLSAISNKTVARTQTTLSSLGTPYNFDHIDIRTGMVIDKLWAGPSHWKLKNVVHTDKEVFTGRKTTDAPKKRCSRKKKEAKPLDFSKIDEVEVDMTRISPKPPKRLPEHKLFLPMPDFRLLEQLQDAMYGCELFTRPGVYVRTGNEDSQQQDNSTGHENDDNGDDGFDNSMFVPADGDAILNDDNLNDGVQALSMITEEHQVAEIENLRDNLVEAPQMVESDFIPYATKAKQMNMKKLKNAIWQDLTKCDETATHDQARRGKVVPTTFGILYANLPNLLKGKEKENISCPLTFVALLHLCNEETLALKKIPSKNDFTIEGRK